MSTIDAIILAAGLGTRMKSSTPKMLHRVLDTPMVAYPVKAAFAIGASRVVVVLGHGAEAVSSYLKSAFGDKVLFAHQAEPKGTADAVRAALPALQDSPNPRLILNGDLPLLRPEDLSALSSLGGAKLRFASFYPDNIKGYGRVVRTDGKVSRIVEDKDANPQEKQIVEANAGLYLVEASFLERGLSQVKSENTQREFYLPDLIQLAAQEEQCEVVVLPKDSVSGVNDRSELAQVEAIARKRRNHQLMLSGVTLIDPESTYISAESQIAQDVILQPNVSIRGNTTIDKDTTIGNGTILKDTKVGAGVEVRAYCVSDQAEIGPGCIIGPFAHLRPGTRLASKVHIGNFVETKNAKIGEGSKANHLTYLGDAQIGSGSNIGAGTITCNYDGVSKHTTTIGDNVFVGSDVQFVAPVTIGNGALIGAGACITEDVPENAFAVTRAPQQTKPEGALRYWAKRKKK